LCRFILNELQETGADNRKFEICFAARISDFIERVLIFWDKTPFGTLKVNGRFIGISRLHLKA
jgi:hypothetical protein